MTGIKSMKKTTGIVSVSLKSDPKSMREAQRDESIDPATRWLEVSGQDKIRNFCDAAVAWWRGSCTWRFNLAGLRPLSLDPELRYRYRSAERYDAAGDTVPHGGPFHGSQDPTRGCEMGAVGAPIAAVGEKKKCGDLNINIEPSFRLIATSSSSSAHCLYSHHKQSLRGVYAAI